MNVTIQPNGWAWVQLEGIDDQWSFASMTEFKAFIRAGVDHFNSMGEPIDYETEPATFDAVRAA